MSDGASIPTVSGTATFETEIEVLSNTDAAGCSSDADSGSKKLKQYTARETQVIKMVFHIKSNF